MKFIKLTQGKRAIVDDEDFERVNQFKWHYFTAKRTGYAKNREHRMMHQFIMNDSRHPQIIDHINHNGIDNRKKNLRFTTHLKNCNHRRGVNRNNTSGVRGVYWTGESWLASIRMNNVRYHVGLFKSLSVAKRVIAEKRRMMGEQLL